MASPVRVNLNRTADWKSVLEAVEISTVGGLPLRITCPTCSSRSMSIHEDSTFGGVWHHCSACDAHGDGIELAAAVWECSPGVAVRRLAASGVPFSAEETMPETIAAYAATYPQRRKWIERFWASCRSYAEQPNPMLNQLRHKLKIQTTLSQERWAAGPGMLLGGNCRTEIERLGVENHHVIPGSTARKRGNVRTILSGNWRSWQEALTIPFYDLPGRICGFQFSGSSGRIRDRVYHSVHAACLGKRDRLFEGGLAGWPMINKADPNFGKHVTVCDDAFLAVRLQVRHAMTSNVLLPLLAFCDAPQARTSRAVWRAVSDKIPVFWGFKLTAALLNQAMEADGMLSLIDLRGDTSTQAIDHYIRDNAPRDMLARVVRLALPWRDRFALWAEKRPAAEIEQLFLDLETYGNDLRELRQLTPRLRAMVQTLDRPKSCVLGGNTIIERGDKWWLTPKVGGPSLITNAAIRIEGTNFDVSPAAYHGRVFFAGTEIPFRRSIDDLLAHPTRCFNEIINTQHTNAVLYVAPHWAPRLIPLGMKFAGLTS